MKYKKFTKKKPHPYCFKDDFYYHLLSINSAANCKDPYISNREFSFDDLNFNIDFKQIVAEKGHPDCFTMSDEKGVPLQVAGYKSRMFHSNEKTLLYFCNKNYFMGEYVFSELGTDTPSLIVEILRKEFHSEIKYAKNITIKDKSGNCLFFTDTGFHLSIKFFNERNESVRKIAEFINNVNSQENPNSNLVNLASFKC
ncbi:MAG: hypothetical protein GQ527_12725 [Bacteroidales bacterium]|nr:hypothetical protein [Bacteroidales bacterium]